MNFKKKYKLDLLLTCQGVYKFTWHAGCQAIVYIFIVEPWIKEGYSKEKNQYFVFRTTRFFVKRQQTKEIFFPICMRTGVLALML